MKAMAMKKAAALILSLAMVFTLMPLVRAEEAHALQIYNDIYVDVSGYQTNYTRVPGLAMMRFIEECIDNEVVSSLTYVSQEHVLLFYRVDLDKNGNYDLQVSPEYDNGGNLSGLTLMKYEESNLNGRYDVELPSSVWSRYAEMGEDNEYGLQYFYSRVHFEMESQCVQIINSKTIDLYSGPQTFDGLEGQAVHHTLDMMAEKGIITKSERTQNNQGAFVTSYDLDKKDGYDINETYRIDRTSNTISKLDTYSLDEYHVVSGTDELAAEMAQKTILELLGVDHLYKSFIFSTVPPIGPTVYSIDNAPVELSAAEFTYNGEVQKPEILKVDGLQLAEGTDYTAEWSNASSTDPGEYTVTVTGIGGYEGTTQATYVIKKADNTLKASGKTATVKFSKLKKKSQTLKTSKVLKFASKGEGKLTYKRAKGNKKITINKTTGKVTVKKGLKKGTYTVKVKIQAAGDDHHDKSAWKTVTFKVKVKYRAAINKQKAFVYNRMGKVFWR